MLNFKYKSFLLILSVLLIIGIGLTTYIFINNKKNNISKSVGTEQESVIPPASLPKVPYIQLKENELLNKIMYDDVSSQIYAVSSLSFLYQIDPISFKINKSLDLKSGNILSLYLDGQNKTAYLILYDKVINIDLNEFKIKNTLNLLDNYQDPATSFLDLEKGYLYLGFYTIPGRIVIIDLAQMKVFKSTELRNLKEINSIFADSESIYIASSENIKSDLTSVFQKINSKTLKLEKEILLPKMSGEGVLDRENNKIYLPSKTYPPSVMIIDLSNFTVKDNVLAIKDNKFSLAQLIINKTKQQIILPVSKTPCKIIIINDDFKNISENNIEFVPNDCYSAILDEKNQFLYLGGKFIDNTLNYIIKIDLNNLKN